MSKTYKLALTIISIIILTLVYVSLSYASFNKKEEEIDTASTETIVTSNEFISVNFLDGNYYEISHFNSNDTIVKRITVTNVSNESTYFTIAVMDINKKSNELNIRLIDSESNEVYNNSLGNADTELLKTAEINPKETKCYTLLITYNGEFDSYGLTANLMVYKESAKKEITTLKDLIMKNNELQTIQTNYQDGSTIAEGLLSANDDYGTSYYFRGIVENNYVKFANYTWRILRVNGDGSVRLILNNILADTFAYKDSINTSDYLSNVLYSSTNIKLELDSWLATELNDYNSYLADTMTCSDSLITNDENNTQNIASYTRNIIDNNPTFNCLGTKEYSKIGLITIDEAILAGASTKNNNLYYLYNPSIYTPWWTSSSSLIISRSNVIDAFAINQQGALSYQNKITAKLALRPIVTIDKTVVSTGTGTLSDPYLIG